MTRKLPESIRIIRANVDISFLAQYLKAGGTVEILNRWVGRAMR